MKMINTLTILFLFILMINVVQAISLPSFCILDCEESSVSIQGDKYDFSDEPIILGNITISGTKFDFKDNKSFRILYNKSHFNITSTSEIYTIGDFSKTKEWGHKKGGTEFIQSDKDLIYRDRHICIENEFIVNNAGSLLEEKIYTNCIYYPLQLINMTFNETTIKINVRNVTKLSSKLYRVDHLDDYDPTEQLLLTGLISYYDFNNTDDVHDGDNDATNSGAIAVINSNQLTGKYYQFDDTTDKWTFATDSISSTPFTYSFWMYKNTSWDNGGADNVIANSDSECGGGGFLYGYNYGDVGVYDGAWSWCEPTKTPPVDEWVHVVITFDDSDIYYYINGNENVTCADSVDDSKLIDECIGQYDATDNNFMMDEFGIWNKVLNSSQVLALYNEGDPLLYPFEVEVEGAGTISVELIQPDWNYNHTENKFYMYQLNVSCAGGACNNINATLDPELSYGITANIDDGSEEAGAADDSLLTLLIDEPDEYCLFRFAGVTIPSGSTITSAILDNAVYAAASDEPYHTIYFEDIESAGQIFDITNNISSRVATTNSVQFGNGDAIDCLALQYTAECATPTLPDLTDIIQELIDSYDYSSGNAMAAIIQADLGAKTDDWACTFREHTGGIYAAYLNISYDPPTPFDKYWLNFELIQNLTNNESIFVNFTTSGNYTYTEWYRNSSLIANDSNKYYNFTGLLDDVGYNITLRIHHNVTLFNKTYLLINTSSNPPETFGIYWLNFDLVQNLTNNESIFINFTYSGNYTYTEWFKNGTISANNSDQAYNYTGLLANIGYNMTVHIHYNTTLYNSTEHIITTDSNEVTKSGVVSVVEGDTPFYALNSSNPTTEFNLNDGESAIIGFYVNATGEIDSTHEFFWIVLSDTSDDVNSTRFNVTIIESTENTCTYASGDWNIDCADSCVIDAEEDIGGNDIIMTGTGVITWNIAAINYGLMYAHGDSATDRCRVRLL